MSSPTNHANSPLLDTARCPLCGGPNQCALAADPTATECWCDSLTIPRELLDQIPGNAVRKTCVCKECIKQFLKSTGFPNNASQR
ncbi:MAG: cysteine-rich CWC family protein [Anaerolineaceae bacterium]|nr:MAG: cysteine-rich CWC family protein [Anaerolineaceae bacterium]